MVKVGKYEFRRLRSRKPGCKGENDFFLVFLVGAPFCSNILYKFFTFCQKTVFLKVLFNRYIVYIK